MLRWFAPLLASAAMLAGGPVHAQPSPVPQFRDYPAGGFTGRPASVVLGPGDMAYRTQLREAARQRPNFAGSSVLATWGCGMKCVMGAAVDLRTGHAAWLPGTLCCWPADVDDRFEPVKFRLDSTLVVLSGLRNEREGDQGTHFYRLQGGHFIYIRSILQSDRQR